MDNDKKVEKESNDIEHVSYSEKDKNGDFSEVYGYYEERIDEMREFFNKHCR